ncbi:hypothetical protein [Brevibacterium renqingii]|uniref:hypothetical protein n=1 Tax=Brevibacterium renqingii TaxID=2776916 RepID=UPI001ADEE65F|nr:hypothetical protein [Brevibacterium renqingii]
MIVLAAAFIVIPLAIIIWVAYVGALGLRFCWNTLFRYSEMETVGEHQHGDPRR